jgi:hypothetical protein
MWTLLRAGRRSGVPAFGCDGIRRMWTLLRAGRRSGVRM